MDDGKSGAVYNVKNEHYAAMPGSFQAKNNKEINIGMGYNNMADMANVAHPPVQMEDAKQNLQLGPTKADNNYNYNGNRGNR